MDNSLIDNRIQQVRKGNKIAKMDFYAAIEMTDSGYSKMIANNTMKISTLYKIAEVLKVAPEYLMYEKDEDLLVYKVLEATFTAARDEGEKLLAEIKQLEQSRNEWKEKYYQLLDMKITMVMPDEDKAKKTAYVAAVGSEHELTIAAEDEIKITKTKK
jgi:transcriptional regulator with XRE-family HTH domain